MRATGGATPRSCGRDALLVSASFDAVVLVLEEKSLGEAAARMKPEVEVVDLSLAKRELAGLLGRLRQRCPALKIIVIGGSDAATVSASALEDGAEGFVSKHAVATGLVRAVEAVRCGERYVAPSSSSGPSGDN